MGVDAINQTICPSVLGMTKCSIAFGRWPHPVALWGLILFNNFITGTYLHNPMDKTDIVYALNQYVGKLNIVV
jgi:hypothetical protein